MLRKILAYVTRDVQDTASLYRKSRLAHCDACGNEADEWVTIRWQLNTTREDQPVTLNGKGIAELCMACAMPAREDLPGAVLAAIRVWDEGATIPDSTATVADRNGNWWHRTRDQHDCATTNWCSAVGSLPEQALLELLAPLRHVDTVSLRRVDPLRDTR